MPDERNNRVGTATGFAFQEATANAMIESLDRALALYGQPIAWCKMQRRAMSRDFGWSVSAQRYLALYRQLAPHAAVTDGERDEQLLEAVG